MRKNKFYLFFSCILCISGVYLIAVGFYPDNCPGILINNYMEVLL